MPDTATPPPPPTDPPPRRILLIRPSALGDVCRSVPVLVSLKRAYPAASIDWLVQDTFAPAVAHHPDLSGVVSFPRRDLGRWTDPNAWRGLLRFLHGLRQRRYDLVLDCQGLARSGLFAAATGAPRRVGLANAAELGWLGLTEAVHAPRSLHAVDRMLLVAEAAGAEPVADLRLYSAPSDREAVQRDLGLAPQTYIVLAPTSRWPGKLWPADRFAAVAGRLLDLLPADHRIVFIGAASERPQCAALEALAGTNPRILGLVGRTTVGQLLAVIEGARLVIASDSAALHMAAGFSRPLIGLFGPTDVSRVGPYRREADVLQLVSPNEPLDHKDAGRGRALMERISVEAVLAAAAERLSPR